ncbi:septum formation initiator family protein [Thermobrachium celere]|uniref:septum formation initiator family protein n=1 Tax=Thermobrachium celere TaxID=53422 RepID=UPI001945ACAE|nr:septum formation initiator family protein [Thermobrachium celere]GFR34996.1 cell division protein FtsL [Thermobrachium celere]
MVMTRKKGNYVTSGNVAYKVQVNEKREVKKVQKTKQKQNRNIKAKVKVLQFIGMLFLFSVLTLSRFVVIYNMNSQLRDLKKQIVQIQKENENLQVELAKINNIKNIENVAVTKYNMINPKAEEVRFVDVKMLASTEEKKVTAYEIFQKIVGFIY